MLNPTDKYNQSNRKILITTALPYSNGSIHLGHVLEHIQADIWKHFQIANGNDCYFCCADDNHGTAVILYQLNHYKTLLLIQTYLEQKQQKISYQFLFYLIFIPIVVKSICYFFYSS